MSVPASGLAAFTSARGEDCGSDWQCVDLRTRNCSPSKSSLRQATLHGDDGPQRYVMQKHHSALISLEKSLWRHSTAESGVSSIYNCPSKDVGRSIGTQSHTSRLRIVLRKRKRKIL